jgi:hypothetical protein
VGGGTPKHRMFMQSSNPWKKLPEPIKETINKTVKWWKMVFLFLLLCKIRCETEQKRIRTDTQHAVRPVSTRFLLNYEAKRWSKADFFYINEIAIFRRSWRYHWTAPGSWNKRDITSFTPPSSNTSLCFFIEVVPGQPGGDL